ncbi:unnamed protein product [Thelazia callipaeda]|uniref:Adenosine 5'-monophosphoramidase HINT3 n=1 Tax=Thelazia callipaeda TaxID=103827 RepID=A0A0N5D5H5_THECL|nr:unnamed protein product [Thelazia callipaeda]
MFLFLMSKRVDFAVILNYNCSTVVIEDKYPHAPHHYLILSKRHINKSSDLKVADLPLVREMGLVGRDYLRETLKKKGEADTVEDLLRMGFHWSKFVSVNHLHMHVLYPISEMKIFYRWVIFRPGRFFRTTSSVIEELEKQKNEVGQIDLEEHMQSNTVSVKPEELSEKKVLTAAATLT